MPNAVQTLVALASLAAGALAGPADLVNAAAADASRVPAEIRQHLRYLSKPPRMDGQEWAEHSLVLAFHLNSLSREADLVMEIGKLPDRNTVPTAVVGDLLRINTLELGWDLKVWERFAALYPYAHVKLVATQVPVVPVIKPAPVLEALEEPGGKPIIDGVQFYRDSERNTLVEVDAKDLKFGETIWVRDKPGGSIRKVRVPDAPPASPRKQLPPKEKEAEQPQPRKQVENEDQKEAAAYAALGLLTNSAVPLVRADWFVWQTGAQFKRGGAGYYDFMGFKKREDIERFVSLDVAAAKRVRKEIAAIVSESGVAVNNRQVVRYQTLTGGYWATLDVDDNEGNHNAVEVLNGDFKHQAEEIYAPHMNGLFVYGASDADGTLQDKVPVKFAGDSKSTSNNVEIEPFYSCVRCHQEGLRPIDDWARKVYTGPVKLASPDYAKLKRLQRMYLSDLPGQLKLDQEAYARTLKKVNGLTPEANARSYSYHWKLYADTSLSLDDTAAELGADPKEWRKALVAYAEGKLVSPRLAGLIADNPVKMRREHWADVYPLALGIMRSWKPQGDKP